MSTIRINLCGHTRVVTAAGEELDKLGGVKPRQVLELLALSLGRPLSKDRIAGLLWEDNPPASYVGTLESYVCVLRRELGSKGRDSVIQTTTTGYLLRRDRVSVDLDTAHRLLQRARGGPADAGRLLDSALTMLDGELLASEPHATWAQAQRYRHRQETVELLCDVAARALAAGHLSLALQAARAATTRDPLTERAWQILMQVLLAEARPAEALACYATLRAHFLDQLGVEPSGQSRTLYDRALRESAAGSVGASSTAEVSALMRLLRQALESVPGVRVPEGDEPLSAVAVRFLQTAC